MSGPTPESWTVDAPQECDVAVVGGGFSGMMTLVHLCRAMPRGRFAVIERRPRRAPGVAYGGCDDGHLLNVPAGRMGAFPDDVGGFHAWLARTHPGAFGADDFAPRALFGRYLGEVVGRELAAAGAAVSMVRDAVVHLERVPFGVELVLASGRTMVARAAVIAPGLPPARTPWAKVDHGAPRGALCSDPWEPGSLDLPSPDSEVLVLGSGLTAIDIVQGLRRAGNRGRIHLVSRNGRLPLPHAPAGEPPMQLPLERFAGGPARAMAALRSAARERAAAGLGWQGAVDAIRPHVTAIWRSWTPAQRRRFLRLARPLWEIHRHRAPRGVLQDMEAQLAAGAITLERGDLADLRPAAGGSGAEATIRRRDGSTRRLAVARVFNCIGPGMSVRDTIDPMIGSLIRGGIASTDELGLGIRTDADGHLVSADGTVDARVVLVGALRRGELWETTAVPELRVQAAAAARAAAAAACGTDGRSAV
jgi:uncharacterized NAD(P)/FAD-binding protein YdhS